MDLKITSANIRFENPADGPHDWPMRREFLCDILNAQNLDLLGTQEGREPQLRDLESLLPHLQLCDHNRSWISERMYPCIYYNAQTIEVHDSGDSWLSTTPDVAGSIDFDSAFPRLSTWIKATHIPSGQKFFYINCHLDHVKEETRVQQARVLSEEVLKRRDESLPLIITGDFNSSPQGEVRKTLEKNLSELRDPWIDLNYKEETSFHKFDGKDPTGEATRIDWLLHTNQMSCSEIRMIKESRESLYPSDHFFIHGKLKFRA